MGVEVEPVDVLLRQREMESGGDGELWLPHASDHCRISRRLAKGVHLHRAEDPPCFISFMFTARAALLHRSFFTSSGVRTISSAMIGIGEDSVSARIPSQSLTETGCSKKATPSLRALRAKDNASLQEYPWFPSTRSSMSLPTASRIAFTRFTSAFQSLPTLILSARNPTPAQRRARSTAASVSMIPTVMSVSIRSRRPPR